MAPTTTRIAVGALALTAGCGLHSAITAVVEAERDAMARAIVHVEVGCYDSQNAGSVSDWWNDRDDCSQAEVCRQVRWLDASAAEARANEQSPDWLAEHTIGLWRECEEMPWSNSQTVTPVRYTLVSPPQISRSVGSALVEVDAKSTTIGERRIVEVPPPRGTPREVESAAATARIVAAPVVAHAGLLGSTRQDPLPCEDGARVVIDPLPQRSSGVQTPPSKMRELGLAMRALSRETLRVSPTRCIVFEKRRPKTLDVACRLGTPLLQFVPTVEAHGVVLRLDKKACPDWQTVATETVPTLPQTDAARAVFREFVQKHAFSTATD